MRLEVRDTGPGIPEADLPRIFDAYFTTRRVGRGLGLTIVQSVARRHGGHVDVASAPGRGTAMSLWLPIGQSGTKGGRG